MKLLKMIALPLAISLCMVSVVSASTYYLLVTPQSSVENQSTSQRNIDLSMDVFTSMAENLFHDYYICPTNSSDAGDFAILVDNCRNTYIGGFNTPYNTYNTNINTGAQLLYPGPNNIGCIVLSSKDNYNDYQLCEDYGHTVRVNYTGNLFPVYRFWSNKNQHHFYTIEAPEKTNILNTYDSETWKYESIAWTATKYTGRCSAGVPIYRYWSDSKHSHFYTNSLEEKAYIDKNWVGIWKYEGIAYCAGVTQTPDNPKAVYRFWSDKMQGHFFTASLAERDSIISKYPSNVWKYEGVSFYVN